MAIRIYALAKELKIDAKELMTLCDELKIVTKGSSSLGSLSDEDAARVREYVKSGNFLSGECGGQGICHE